MAVKWCVSQSVTQTRVVDYMLMATKYADILLWHDISLWDVVGHKYAVLYYDSKGDYQCDLPLCYRKELITKPSWEYASQTVKRCNIHSAWEE